MDVDVYDANVCVGCGWSDVGCFLLEDVEGFRFVVEVMVAGVECFIVVVLWRLFGGRESTEGKGSIFLEGD